MRAAARQPLAVGVQQGTQAVAPRGLVLRVDVRGSPGGASRSHPAVAPRPPAGRTTARLARRVAAVGRLVPVGPRMRDRAFAFGIEGSPPPEHADDDRHGRRVPGPAAYRWRPDSDVAVFIALFSSVTTIERLGGQGQQRLSVLVEQAVSSLPVMILVPQFEAAAGQAQVEAVRVPPAGRTRFAEQPAAPGPDHLASTAPSRVPSTGCRTSTNYQWAGTHGTGRSRRISSNRRRRPTPAALSCTMRRGTISHSEQVPKGTARALRVLPGHQLARPDVRVRNQHENAAFASTPR